MEGILIIKRLTILITTLFVLSCATTYQSQSWTGGFSETQLDTNVYTVRFRGNGYTSSARASDFTLLRSAELTLENGYKYFMIIDSGSYRDISQTSIPQQNYNYGTISGDGGTAYYSGYDTTYENITVTRPRSENTIMMFKEKPKKDMSYDAAFISKSIKDKYSLNEE